MKNSKSLKIKSFILLGFIYLLAFLAAYGTYSFGKTWTQNQILLVFIADVVATLVVWLFGLLLKNASTYDPYWSVAPIIIVLSFVIILQASFSFSVLLLLLAVMIWGIRLTYNWAINWHDFSYQDWRYSMIKKKKPKIWFLSNLFGINLMPTLIVFIQLISAYYYLSSNPTVNFWILLGFIICIFASAMQFISDKQMRKFRKDNKTEKKCIDSGLWKFSRHPNYFGEVMMWWGLYVMYFGIGKTIDYFIIAPILMNALFLFISIPMMEKKILTSRPEYNLYMERVSILLPFFPKKQTNESYDEVEA